MKYVTVALFFVVGVFFTSSCQQTSSDSSAEKSIYSANFYFKQITSLELDVVFEAGAEPYVGTTTAGLNFWDITLQNLQALFSGRSVSVVVPKTLSEMREITTQNRSIWTVKDALSLANQYRKGDSGGTTGKIFIAFVKGYASSAEGTPSTEVIGFSVTDSNVILIFKEVVRGTGFDQNDHIPKFVEQSTIVHEIAHSVGFVNKGVKQTTLHHDSPHGAHCTNSNCVMYYMNEGTSDLANFIDKFKDSQNAVMFDDACLNDAKSF